MKKKILLNSLIFFIGFFISYSLYYYVFEREDFGYERLIFCLIVSFLSAITLGGINFFINKNK